MAYKAPLKSAFSKTVQTNRCPSAPTNQAKRMKTSTMTLQRSRIAVLLPPTRINQTHSFQDLPSSRTNNNCVHSPLSFRGHKVFLNSTRIRQLFCKRNALLKSRRSNDFAPYWSRIKSRIQKIIIITKTKSKTPNNFNNCKSENSPY